MALQASAGNQAVARLLALREVSIGDALGTLLSTAMLASVGAIELHGTVGRGGRNLPEDVEPVRDRLGALGFAAGEGVGGLAEAIDRYQVEVVGFPRPDGRVDLGGRTLAALNTGRRVHKPAAKPQAVGAPATQTTEAPAPVAASAPAVVGNLAELVAQAHNPQVNAAAAKLTELEQQFRTMKHGRDATHQSEEIGPERAALVSGIRDLRQMIAGLDSAGLPAAQLKAIQPALYRGINAVSPFYYQHNNVMYEYSKEHGDTAQYKQISKGFNTCNTTSLAMCLEALGKTAADHDQPDALAQVLAFFKGHELKKSGVEASADIGAYRLPDVVGVAATLENLSRKTGATPEDMGAAAVKTLAWIANIDHLRQIALHFGVPGVVDTYHHDALEKFGKTHDKLALEQGYRRKRGKATSGAGLSTDEIEKEVPLEKYKRDILRLIGPKMDAGKQVVVGQFYHFVRLQSLDEDFVIKDDPGGYDRNDLKQTWEEARALGLFENYLVLG